MWRYVSFTLADAPASQVGSDSIFIVLLQGRIQRSGRYQRRNEKTIGRIERI